jgi:hypothetical protein
MRRGNQGETNEVGGDQESAGPESQEQKKFHEGQSCQILLPDWLILRLRLDHWIYGEESLLTLTRTILEVWWGQEPNQDEFKNRKRGFGGRACIQP